MIELGALILSTRNIPIEKLSWNEMKIHGRVDSASTSMKSAEKESQISY